MTGFGVLFFGIFICIIAFTFASAAAKKKQDRLANLAIGLGGSVLSTNSVSARRNEIEIVYTFADRGVGSSHEPWTEVVATLPPQYPLTIRIVRGRPKPGKPVVDIELGTPLFDDYFIVEAAPADVVRQLIDEPARMFLARQHERIELETVDGGLRLSMPGWIEDPSHARGLADYVALLGSRVRDAYAAANAQVAPRDRGSPYRPQIDTSGEDVQAAREREIAEVHQVRALRAEQERRTATIVTWAMIGGFVLLAVVIESL